MWEKTLRYWAHKEGASDEFYDILLNQCKDQYDIIDKFLGGSKWIANARRLTKAEKAVLELSELNKLVFALREAGLKSKRWSPRPGDAVRERGLSYGDGKRNGPSR